MGGHENLVTYSWLIGTAIAILGIVGAILITLYNANSKQNEKKVNVNVCEERHIPIDLALQKLDKINDAVIRIETILLKNQEGS